MSAHLDLVQRYIAIWNETDAGTRLAAVRSVFTDDGGQYVDPNVSAEGAEAIESYIGGTQQALGGQAFSLAGAVDGHHDLVRFSWLVGPADAPVATGTDVAVIADGRIRTLYGFFD